MEANVFLAQSYMSHGPLRLSSCIVDPKLLFTLSVLGL